MSQQEILIADKSLNIKAPVREEDQIFEIMNQMAKNPETIGQIDSLINFKERIEKSNALKSFNQAMVKAIGSIPSFERAKQGHNYKYTTFEDINKVVKPILKENGLFMSFRTDYKEAGFIDVTAKITHEQGHSEETTMRLPFDSSGSKNSVQAVGSAVQYGKRYTQSALMNITTHDEDDDGFASTKKISEDEIERLNLGIEKAGIKLKELTDHMGVELLSDIPKDKFNDAGFYLKQIIDGKEAINANK